MATLHHPAAPVNGLRPGSPAAPAADDSDVMTPAQAAAVLGMGVRTVHYLCRDKVLPSYRRGNSKRSPINLLRPAVLAYKAGGDPWAAVGTDRQGEAANG